LIFLKESESEFFSRFIVGDQAEFQSYISKMRRDGEWGDHVEIQAMSEIYDRPIEIYAYSDGIVLNLAHFFKD
jgi:OTU domain-containing protein 5